MCLSSPELLHTELESFKVRSLKSQIRNGEEVATEACVCAMGGLNNAQFRDWVYDNGTDHRASSGD